MKPWIRYGVNHSRLEHDMYDDSLELAGQIYQECLAMQAEAAEYGLLLPSPSSIGCGGVSAEHLNKMFNEYLNMFAALEIAKNKWEEM